METVPIPERSVGKVRKKLPIGIENFAEFSSEDFYYVDKTLFIKELLQNWGKVNLFTLPRRFGKSLNMSMLKYFLKWEWIQHCSKALGSCRKRICVKNTWGSSQ